MEKLLFYTKESCSLCDEAEVLLEMFQQQYKFEVEKRDIYSKDEWLEAYHLVIPVIEVNGNQLDCEQLDYDALEKLLKTNVSSK
ncbi:glutaredoxin family protein [Ornithinibacillus contaminans]|uniref:glutaredoxin family protein n=1 Tax=Ornithinibacillus contaminans TaxID=694055 RepID=UPI00064DE41A|nr:glutaredoxin family protein [Ornithinibacillus contaminans]